MKLTEALTLWAAKDLKAFEFDLELDPEEFRNLNHMAAEVDRQDMQPENKLGSVFCQINFFRTDRSKINLIGMFIDNEYGKQIREILNEALKARIKQISQAKP